jgi:hypothetical protein
MRGGDGEEGQGRRGAEGQGRRRNRRGEEAHRGIGKNRKGAEAQRRLKLPKGAWIPDDARIVLGLASLAVGLVVGVFALVVPRPLVITQTGITSAIQPFRRPFRS